MNRTHGDPVDNINRTAFCFCVLGKGGKNRRRGKNENESEKRELVFKEDGQGEYWFCCWVEDGSISRCLYPGCEKVLLQSEPVSAFGLNRSSWVTGVTLK